MPVRCVRESSVVEVFTFARFCEPALVVWFVVLCNTEYVVTLPRNSRLLFVLDSCRLPPCQAGDLQYGHAFLAGLVCASQVVLTRAFAVSAARRLRVALTKRYVATLAHLLNVPIVVRSAFALACHCAAFAAGWVLRRVVFHFLFLSASVRSLCVCEQRQEHRVHRGGRQGRGLPLAAGAFLSYRI